MAYQSARNEIPCYGCGTMRPYFKLIGSWRPEHSLDGPMTLMEEEGKEPMTGRRGRRICPMCE
eukprot:11744287-Prorocentrum_lima.AAC.1